MLNNKSILITGGTGSFGKKCTEIILKRYKPKRLIIFSRDELKQFEMVQVYPETIEWFRVEENLRRYKWNVYNV